MAWTLEQLLATLAVDAATASVVSGRLAVVQRDPQPDETGIGITSPIRCLVVDLDADPLEWPSSGDLSFTMLVDGVLAATYVGGVITPEPGWAATVTPPDTSAPFVAWAIEVTRTAPWTSEQLVAVVLNVSIPLGWGSGPWGHFPWGHSSSVVGPDLFSWSFTAADVTPPQVVSAAAVGPCTVRITFDDAMTAADVLTLANWPDGCIECQNVDPNPGVHLEVVAVAEVDGSGATAWDLTTQWEQTPGCQYEITAALSLTDDAGNAIDPAARTATWAGWVPVEVPGRVFDLIRWLPLKNREEDATRDLVRLVNCWQELAGLLIGSVDAFPETLIDPDRCPDEVLDAMLWDMGNPFDWDELELDGDQRRKLLRFLLPIYQYKGTAAGVEDTIWFLLGERVQIVDYLAEGWVLGVDSLGSGSIAEVVCDAAETYDMSGCPLTLEVEIDDGSTQVATFQLADFAVPASATAEELAAAAGPQLVGGGAYSPAAGTPAILTSGNVEPFAVAAGDTLELLVHGTAHVVTFHAADVATSGAALAAELATRLEHDLGPDVLGDDNAGAVELRTVLWGLGASLEVTGGTVAAALGFPAGAATGTDAARLALYSETAGADASIAVVGGTALAVLPFTTSSAGSTSTAVLAPDDSYTCYCFDIETQGTLAADLVALIRRIAVYLKPAHTHLRNVRAALPTPWPDGWTIGVSHLDTESTLGL
jgi:phage tail-like protein